MTTREIKKIQTDKAPQAIGPYSQAISAGDMVFVSGQIPIEPSSGEVITGAIEKETQLVIDNTKSILTECGLTLDDVVKVDIFLKDMNDFTLVNDVYSNNFKGDVKPSRCVVQVARLPKDVGIEMSSIAFKG